MDTRRAFLKKSILLSGAYGLSTVLSDSVQKAMAITADPGTTYRDAEHVVILMQENRSFDHCFGSLRGVRGYNDPRAIVLPNQHPVWMQTNAAGKTFTPFRLNIKDTKSTWMGDLPHSRASQVDALNEGKYDRWLDAKRSHHQQYAEMPLTLGHYTREDLPFHYAMADAFTVCDQYFCSAVTSTTPNRSYFWTGNIISNEQGVNKFNIRNTDYKAGKQTWSTFPELLETNNIPWKFYQNELSTGGGFSEDERSWLSNFGCNVLEFFENYHVKFSERYVRSIQERMKTIPPQIDDLKKRLSSPDLSGTTIDKLKKDIDIKRRVLDEANQEWITWTRANFDQLSEEQKKLFNHAFTINDQEPDFRSVTRQTYSDNGASRQLTVPKGDLFHQFRKDVNSNKLPAVSWLASPQNFSDHPSAPWYGAWYVSEILDILTKNPEVWKKTIFILTYDENDGYFDHVPPFLAPDLSRPETGKCSAGIDTEVEWVRLKNEILQGVPAKEAREAPVGLGFRVPMIIASPWSRGGNVCSQVFDHTSTMQFLETFINEKWGKNIRSANISEWRRTVCGNLTSAFTTYRAKGEELPFLSREPFMETIFNAQFRREPSGYKELSSEDIERYKKDPYNHPLMQLQENGVKSSAALPYELYADGDLSNDGKEFNIHFAAGDRVFGKLSAGSPYTVYAAAKYLSHDQKAGLENGRIWSYAVKAGDHITDSWPLANFENEQYYLRVCGPNGFWRVYRGSVKDPKIRIYCEYENRSNGKPLSGNIKLRFLNTDRQQTIEIVDNSYKNKPITRMLAASASSGEGESIVLDLQKSFGWYDFSIKINGAGQYERRFAGRVETGAASFTDPLMGRVDL